jgi:hypothetical protein
MNSGSEGIPTSYGYIYHTHIIKYECVIVKYYLDRSNVHLCTDETIIRVLSCT